MLPLYVAHWRWLATRTTGWGSISLNRQGSAKAFLVSGAFTLEQGPDRATHVARGAPMDTMGDRRTGLRETA